MNNLAREIRLLRTAYPSITCNMFQVLNQLFCVDGNRYDWINGNLQTDWDDSDKELESVKLVDSGHIPSWTVFQGQIPDLFRNDLLHPELLDILKEKLRTRYKNYIVTNKEHLDNFQWYPISEYSACMDIPLDAHRYWKMQLLAQ